MLLLFLLVLVIRFCICLLMNIEFCFIEVKYLFKVFCFVFIEFIFFFKDVILFCRFLIVVFSFFIFVFRLESFDNIKFILDLSVFMILFLLYDILVGEFDFFSFLFFGDGFELL